MSEFASADGALAVYPGDSSRWALVWHETALAPETTDGLMAESSPSAYLAVGRSALAIGGAIDLHTAIAPMIKDSGDVYIPIELEAHAPVGSQILQHLESAREVAAAGDRVRLRGTELPAGRILHIGGLQPVYGDEIEHAIQEHRIGLGTGKLGEIPPYRVGEDFLALPPAPWKLRVHERKLQEVNNVVDLFLHGRRHLNPYLDARSAGRQDTFDDVTVGTALVSPGPYTIRIEEVSGVATALKQIAGGAWLDAYRTMGLNPLEEPKKRGQQFEVVGNGRQLRFGEAEVIMRFFRYVAEERPDRRNHKPIVAIDSLDIVKRARLHTYGYDVARILGKKDRLAGALKAAGDENCAVVLTPKGATQVADTGSPAFNARDMGDALISSGESRTSQGPGRLTEVSQQLGLVGNNPRVLVAPELEPRFIPGIVERGDAQAVVVRENDIPMTGIEHAAVVNLVRKGVMVAWATDGKIMKLHRSGLKAEPRSFDRLGELDMIIAMYGGNKEIIGEALRGQVGAFFDELIASGTIPAHNLGVIHGNGPGLMRIAHEEAQPRDIMSLGVGMYFNVLGQIRAKAQIPEAYTEFDTPDLTPRQEILTNMSDIKIYNAGGVGTIGHELGEDMTKTKLLRYLPMPSILVDEPGMFDATEAQYRTFADLREITVAGEVVDLRHHPFVQAWVPRKLHHVSSYAEASKLVVEFWKNPAGYWKDVLDIPRKEFAICWASHLAKNMLLGRRVATTLIEGADRFQSLQY